MSTLCVPLQSSPVLRVWEQRADQQRSTGERRGQRQGCCPQVASEQLLCCSNAPGRQFHARYPALQALPCCGAVPPECEFKWLATLQLPIEAQVQIEASGCWRHLHSVGGRCGGSPHLVLHGSWQLAVAGGLWPSSAAQARGPAGSSGQPCPPCRQAPNLAPALDGSATPDAAPSGWFAGFGVHTWWPHVTGVLVFKDLLRQKQAVASCTDARVCAGAAAGSHQSSRWTS